MEITGADHTNWRVRDLERSLRFYRDVLGLEPFGLNERRAWRSNWSSTKPETAAFPVEGDQDLLVLNHH